MEIYVCVKAVPDTETKIKVQGDQIDLSGTKWIINPYDEFAIEEALKLKAAQASLNPIVTVVGVGPKQLIAETLRTALAMGADEAVVLDAQEALDTHMTAAALSQFFREKKPAVIFSGKVAIDDNASAVPQLLAELLNMPHASVVSKFEFKGDSAIVEREADLGSREIIEVKLPAVIGANKGLNTPRYASLPGIMKAKKKTIQEVPLTALGISGEKKKLVYSEYRLPADRPQCKMISGDAPAQAKELVRLLREEAKIV